MALQNEAARNDDRQPYWAFGPPDIGKRASELPLSGQALFSNEKGAP